MRIEIEMRLGQTHRLQDALHTPLALAARKPGVNDQRLIERAADLPARIERGAGILVGVLQAPAERAALVRAQLRDLVALEDDLAGGRRDGCPSRSCRASISRSRIPRRCPGSRPGCTLSETSSSAFSQPVRRPKALRTAKCLASARTSSSGDGAALASTVLAAAPLVGASAVGPLMPKLPRSWAP